MTSLVDVIFLLLLFFMLSSTFARHGELELPLAAGGVAPVASVPPVFVQLLPESLRVNGQEVTLSEAPDAIAALADPAADGGSGRILLALGPDLRAQRLADFLHLMRGFDVWQLHVLGG